ncbi:hypothetical protein [Aliikangiella coralliicola]|uniref:Uncharacterized protein n=1 Tax=Aliikangiella coralliicola TaxID=2592383 RepID=A0A545UB47_9GAMM|nr:hypothetical protein [Aliikangiella coralliicola]TQV86653.1 hypothetical protein FLL46_17320 [Aliikangiella coralliicola]
MKKLKKIGFFSELELGEDSMLSLENSVGKFTSNIEDTVSYLEAGVAIFVSPGLSVDVLSEDKEIIGTMEIRTDGEWAWPSDLTHYLTKYKVELPQNFIDHIKRQKSPPQNIDVSRLDL